MSERPKRKAIPAQVKLVAALRRFNLTTQDVQFDHNPALELRVLNTVTGDLIPPANDPDYIDMLLIDEHKVKTFGRGGEKRISTSDGDIGKIAKMRRLSAKQEESRRRMLSTEPRTEPKPKSRWPKRPMGKKKPHRDFE